jgi:monoamine oxidase
MPSLPSFDAIVVGAGFSGLTAAQSLVTAGKNVLVLEARDRSGGRVKPGNIAGLTIDLGGMWVGTTQKRLRALVEAQGYKTYPTWLEGKARIEMLGRIVDCQREDFAPALPLTAKLEFAFLEGRLRRMIDAVPLDDPTSAPQAAKWDAMSLGEWIRRNVRTKGLRLTLTLITRSVFCVEPDELSLLHFLFYLRSGNGLDALISAETGGAQHLMIEGGLHQVAQRIADGLGDAVLYEAPVMAVEQAQDAISVVTPRGVYSAQRLIMAVAPPLAGGISFAPMLPHARDALHQRMPMGSVIKVWIAYDRPFWRDSGFNGFVFSDQSGFSPCFDVSPPGDGPGLIAGFFDASEASIWSARTPEVRRKEVIALLVRTLGAKALSPLDYVENDWTTERWSRGCYAAYAPPGVWTRFGKALREPIGRIHWAGTETATEGNGYVEGAIQAGERAAAEVIAVLS